MAIVCARIYRGYRYLSDSKMTTVALVWMTGVTNRFDPDVCRRPVYPNQYLNARTPIQSCQSRFWHTFSQPASSLCFVIRDKPYWPLVNCSRLCLHTGQLASLSFLLTFNMISILCLGVGEFSIKPNRFTIRSIISTDHCTLYTLVNPTSTWCLNYADDTQLDTGQLVLPTSDDEKTIKF